MHRSDYTRVTIETRQGLARRTGDTPARRPDEAYAELVQARHEQVAERLSLVMLDRRRGPLD